MTKSNEIVTYLDALDKMKHFCAYRERCHYEVHEKLRNYHLEEDQIFFIVRTLIEENYLNEERFVYAYVSGKFKIKQWGKQKIKMHLKQKQIAPKLIDKAIEQIDQEEYLSLLKDMYLKKFSTYKGKEYEIKSKTIRYLMNKGYSYSDIQIVLEDLNQ